MALTADAYMRAALALLPPGKAWRRDIAAVISEIFLAAGDELNRVDSRGDDLINEIDPRTTDELLPDFLRILNLASSGNTATDQATITALFVRRQRYRPVDFQQVLAPILGLAPSDVQIVERTHAEAVAMGDDREIYRFFIFRNPTLPGTWSIAAAQSVVDKMKPSHTIGVVGESTSFLCDDAHSLCDRDLLGV